MAIRWGFRAKLFTASFVLIVISTISATAYLGSALERDAEIACPRFQLGGCKRKGKQRGGSFHPVALSRPGSMNGNSRGVRPSGSSSRPRAHLWPVYTAC